MIKLYTWATIDILELVKLNYGIAWSTAVLKTKHTEGVTNEYEKHEVNVS